MAEAEQVPTPGIERVFETTFAQPTRRQLEQLAEAQSRS
jgi:hypothetical protein